jgi:Holliday junction resolvase
MNTMPVPTEAEEQKALVQYLRIKGFKHFRVPNETYTKSFRQKANNHALGVVRGVPDLFVVVNHTLLAIEMKRQKGSATSLEQKEWLATLNDAGIPAAVCHGFDEAVTFISKWEAKNKETEEF